MLKDKRAIVTGASQGLGEAIAERLIQEGCRIILTDIQEVQTKEKTAKWKKQYGDVFLNMKCDVTHEPDVEAVLALSEKSWGGVDIFVANAGILISGPIIDFDTARWRQVIDVNLVGQMICMKHALRAMERAKSGSYIQINSKSGKKGSFRNSAYAASKFGGIGLVQSTALEMADKGIRVNAICPGNMLDSPLWVNNLYKQYAKKPGYHGSRSA